MIATATATGTIASGHRTAAMALVTLDQNFRAKCGYQGNGPSAGVLAGRSGICSSRDRTSIKFASREIVPARPAPALTTTAAATWFGGG
jgi:hypothetical protein